MAKTRSYQVSGGRIHFKCPNCQARRLLGVAGNIRRRSIKCHSCDARISAILNRRQRPREQQFGRVILICYDSSQLEVDLFDISTSGVGFEIALRDLTKIAMGDKIQLRCPWNPLLVDRGGYEIRSIQGRRVGAARLRKF